jgi:hypothetical protein
MTVLIAAQREPPYAAIVAVLFLALITLGLARSWWRGRAHPIFNTRKKPRDEERIPKSGDPD